MTPDTCTRIEQALGVKVTQTHPVSGGDINIATRIQLADGRRAFVKTNLTAPKGMFPAEARGLSWLAQARVIRTPEIYAVCRDEATGQAAYLVMEWIEPGRPLHNFDETLGRQLSQLHRVGAPCFGFASDNFIGSLPQANQPRPSWPEFFYDRRLEPQVTRAANSGRLDPATVRDFEKLRARLAELFAPDESPARLHGDLWGGNLHVDSEGNPCLIDPAVYGGHREMDLGMMRLFGGFSSRVFDAYAEAYPLAPGHAERIQLTQLYPLLVHVNLFGGGYAASVRKAVRVYV
jgi:fructosamine-3-kinase